MMDLSPAAQTALRTLFFSSSDAIVSADPQLLVTSWNPAAERLFGYSAAEAIGQPVSLIAPPGEEASQAAALRRVFAGETIDTVETVRRIASGHPPTGARTWCG